MRETVWVSALLFLLTTSAPALASAGLPTLARVDVGRYQVQLTGDSPRLHTGTNTITATVPGLAANGSLSLQLIGPKGQAVPVDLRSLIELTGPSDSHSGDDHGGDSPVDASHDATSHDTMSHHAAGHEAVSYGDDSQSSNGQGGVDHVNASTDGTGHDDTSHDHADSDYQGRGTAVLPDAGTWTAVVTVNDVSESFAFQVTPGGPSRLFLGFSGSVMGAALLYGATQRRLQLGKEGSR